MRVHYRIHKYHSAQERFYVVEEEYATGWEEIKYYGRRLTFSDWQGAAALIEALDGHTGGYVREDLANSMVTN